MSIPDFLNVLSQRIRQGDTVALKKLEKLASSHGEMQAEAAFSLGILFDSSLGPIGAQRDLHTARNFYQVAADLGHAKAQFFLGNMYEFSEGVDRDWSIARHWYALSAKQGERDAQMNLGRLLQTGRGGDIDPQQAAMWYLEAAKQGDELAATNLAFMHLDDEVSPQDHELAIKLLEYSVSKLDGAACLKLGKLSLTGEILDQDIENALKYLFLASKLLPEGENRSLAIGYLDTILRDLAPEVRTYFDEQSDSYIVHQRGRPN